MLSNNPITYVALLFIAGAIIFIVGTMLSRERQARVLDAEHVPVESTSSQPAVDVATRIDLVERLAMVGQSWCVEQLNQIRENDPDASVRDAADAALLVIGARGPV